MMSPFLPGTIIACGIAVDSVNLPHVAFGTPSCLGYASWDGIGWNVEYPHPDVDVGEVDLCLDSDGLPHIGYTGVGYAHWDGMIWHTETVARGSGLTLALARDRTPHMVFVDSSQVKYASKADDTWSIQTIPALQTDTLRRLGGASLAIDTNDRPGIAVNWYKSGQRDSLWLSFFEFDGSNWHRFDVDSADGLGAYDFWVPRVQYDPATDLFHVTYRACAYASGKGSKWQIEEASVSVGNWWYDFALHQSRPHLACSSVMDPLVYQWRDAGGWQSELVADVTARAVSIAVDRTGRPHIAFCDFNLDTLFYGQRVIVGAEEPVPVVGQPKLGLLVSPNPAPRAFTLEFPVRSPSTATIRLCDALGRTVWSQKEEVVPGRYRRRFSLPGSISPGVYFLQVVTDSQRSVEKLILQ